MFLHASQIDRYNSFVENMPQFFAESELADVPKGEPGSAINLYRAIYAMTRQKGLGRTPDGVEASSEFARRTAVEAARSIDPDFDIAAPRGETK